MGIAVLGPLSIDGRETLGRRDRAVLAALAVHPGDVVRTERLYEVLWDERPPASAAKVVQGCVVRLRKELGPGAIVTTSQGYRLAIPADEVDAARFRLALTRGQQLLDSGAFDRASAVLAEALTWWRGDPLPELEDWEPGRVEALQLSELRLHAEELYVESELRRGAHDHVLGQALSMVDDAPLRERRWLLLARAHYQAGRQSDALETLRRLREVLAEELGLDAGAAATNLEEAILRQDPALSVRHEVVEAASVCPYPGLLAYDVQDSAAFFGRRSDVSACLRRLRDGSVVAVVGPSGSGKSSVVRAGVAATLLGDGRKVAVMTPGDHPMRALAAAVGRAGAVLLVDQCEEVFSLCSDVEERTAFLAALVDRAATGQLVISMRADHLGDLAAHPAFARVVERGLYLLGAMTEPDLREAIEGPARRSGLLVEPGLVDLLVNEVERQPGALPMLSHALSETWKRREGRTLTLAAYSASGGIRGAVAKTAEAVYAEGDDDHREALHDLMLRLVTLGDDKVPLRARLPRRLVLDDPAHADVLARLIAARLVTSGDGVVELAHEALARAWPRLRGWLEEDVDGQRIRQHLAVAAEAWDALGRPESELYRGVRLGAALGWRRSSDLPLAELEAEFLDDGERRAQADRVAVEERARRQARANRTLRGLLGVAAVLLVAAMIAGLLAVRQASNADRARLSAVRSSRIADQAATAADARRLGARALTTDDISLSLLLAVGGVDLDDSEESRANLVAAVASRPELVLTGHDLPGHLGQLAGDGSLGELASSDGANRAVFMSRAVQGIGSTQVGVPHRSGHFLQLEFDPKGTTLAAAPEIPEADGRPVAPTLLDTGSQKPVAHQPAAAAIGPAGASDVAWSADGHHLAVAYQRPGASSVALVWDVGSGSPPRQVPLPRGPETIALNHGASVLFASNPLAAYDVGTGRPRWRTSVHGRDLDLASSGRLLALPYDDGVRGSDVLLASTRDGSVVRRLTGHSDRVTEVRFAPDARSAAAAGADGLLLTWRVATGVQVERIETGPVTGLAYSHFGSYVMTTSIDGTARLWDLAGTIRFVTRLVEPRFALDRSSSTVPSTDGRAVASSWTDGGGSSHLRLLDLDTMRAHTVGLGAPLRSGVWSQDGGRFIGVAGERLLEWDRRSGQELRRRTLNGTAVDALELTGAGQTLAAATPDGRLLRLDPATLASVAPELPLGSPICCMAPGPGRHQVTVAIEGASGQVLVVDLSSGLVVRRENVHRQVKSLAVSAARDAAALGTTDGQLAILDLKSGLVHRETGSGHEPPATWTAESSDGRTVVTTAADGSIRLWEGTHAHLLLQLRVPEAARATATFLFGDQDLLLTTRDGGVYRWDSSPDRAQDFACAAAGRPMTRAEWRFYLGTRPFQAVCPTASSQFFDDPTLLEVGDVDHAGAPNR